MADPRRSAPDLVSQPGPQAPVDYKSVGVDIDAGNQVVRRIRELARGTFTPGVLSEIGSFGGVFRPDLSGLVDPVLRPGRTLDKLEPKADTDPPR